MGVNGHWYVEIEKQAFWRGSLHPFVNRYVMSGAQPSASDAAAVIGALKTIEDKLFPATATNLGPGFIEGRAYPSGAGTFFSRVTYAPQGSTTGSTGFTGSSATGFTPAWAPTLETCLLCTTLVNGLNSRGKPVYLRKYFRGVTVGPVEDSSSGQITAAGIASIAAIIAPWWTGMGTNSWVVIANSGAQAASAPTAHPYLVAHQVPRGKKKKASGAGGLLGDLNAALNAAGNIASLANLATDLAA